MKNKSSKEQPKSKTEQKKHQSTLDEFGNHVEKFATRTAESTRMPISSGSAGSAKHI